MLHGGYAMHMDETYIAKRIAQLRTQKGVSGRDMSLSIGQAHNYINRIENGKTAPSVQGLFYICEYLNIALKDFFDEGTQNPTLLNELMTELCGLDDDSLRHILGLVKSIRAK
jgi:transcriptional regulator with XRE-family HTH domain